MNPTFQTLTNQNLFEEICSYLNPAEVTRSGRVCKLWKTMTNQTLKNHPLKETPYVRYGNQFTYYSSTEDATEALKKCVWH